MSLCKNLSFYCICGARKLRHQALRSIQCNPEADLPPPKNVK